MDASTGKSRWQKGVKCPKEYAELDFGEFHYDGSYLLRISDWNRPGFRMDSVTLTPVKLDEVPDAPAASCDTPDGWISLGKAAFSSDDADRREGKAALKVEVPPAAGRKWYDAGVLRPFPMKRASMISFWIKFDANRSRSGSRFSPPEKGVAQKLNPAALGIRKGEWKFLELPVSTFHFRPKRSTVEEVRGAAVLPGRRLSGAGDFPPGRHPARTLTGTCLRRPESKELMIKGDFFLRNMRADTHGAHAPEMNFPPGAAHTLSGRGRTPGRATVGSRE